MRCKRGGCDSDARTAGHVSLSVASKTLITKYIKTLICFFAIIVDRSFAASVNSIELVAAGACLIAWVVYAARCLDSLDWGNTR